MGPLEGDFAIMAGKSAFIINMLALHGLQAKVLIIKSAGFFSEAQDKKVGSLVFAGVIKYNENNIL